MIDELRLIIHQVNGSPNAICKRQKDIARTLPCRSTGRRSVDRRTWRSGASSTPVRVGTLRHRTLALSATTCTRICERRSLNSCSPVCACILPFVLTAVFKILKIYLKLKIKTINLTCGTSWRAHRFCRDLRSARASFAGTGFERRKPPTKECQEIQRNIIL